MTVWSYNEHIQYSKQVILNCQLFIQLMRILNKLRPSTLCIIKQRT